MRVILGVVFFLCFHKANSECFDFSVRVVSTHSGYMRVRTDTGTIKTFKFEDSKYNSRISEGVIIQGHAFLEGKGLVVSPNSIDIPSRNVASLRLSFNRSKIQGRQKCLKSL